MARAPVGQRIRKRRQELGRSQLDLARAVGISASYLNLIEHNKRTIGGSLANRIALAIGLDSRALTGTEEARLIAEVAEAALDPVLVGSELTPDDAREIVASSPIAARALLALYRAYREARLRTDMIGERLGEDSFLAEASQHILALITTIRSYAGILKDYGDLSEAERKSFVGTLVEESERLATRATDMFDFMGGRGASRVRASPREEIEDFISDRANYFPRLEAAADDLRSRLGAPAAPTLDALSQHLLKHHGLSLARQSARTLLPLTETIVDGSFVVSDILSAGSVRFRLARLLARMEYPELLAEITGSAGLLSAEGPRRLRDALASYLAGALIMPYASFHAAAFELRHDLQVLCTRFDASFEQVCHRLATLRRPGLEGIPLHFLRTDIAGNISKRFSASGLQLPRYGGACPRWIVHHAFASPGRIRTQVARLPDGESYFFVARADLQQAMNPDRPLHAVMIGAAIRHAQQFIYADGIDLSAASVVTPVGVTCRQCPRAECATRAFERAAI